MRGLTGIRPWLLASRPKTLAAAVVPVVIGGALAFAAETFVWAAWLICLLFACLIQIATNFANDYYDFKKGADGATRKGPARAVASGWIRPEAMRRATLATFGLAFLVGLLLLPYGGPVLLVVGVASVVCGYAYTGGPYPLGYNGWGDVFVFFFFGWVATGFTYYVQSGSFVVMLPAASGVVWLLLAGWLPGALATNLLVVNNYRDVDEDRLVGKRTLAVRWGRRFAAIQFDVLNAGTLLVVLAFAGVAGTPWTLLVLGSAPLMLISRWRLRQKNYAAALTLTALTLLLSGFLFAIGLIV